MAILSQKTDGVTFYQGWYGLCNDSNEECNNFPLVEGTLANAKKLYPEILKIYEVRGDSLGNISYDGDTDDGFPIHFGSQALNTLKCGHCYYILLRAGESSISIPSFTSANSETIDEKKITDSCGAISTPTPQDNTTPTPRECCNGTDWSYTIINGQSGGDNNVTVRTEGMKTNDPQWDGTLCWENLDTNSNDAANYLIDLRASDISTDSLGQINIILSAVYSGQKFMYTLNSNGVCYTGEMKSTRELGDNGLNIWTPI
tara:strand:- start:1177 stop:1953 length:777 start_codon:yes stop_codon:yes gene_type:complete